jgi:hypothetical protein
MVAGFCIQNKYWMDRISYSWSSSNFNSIDNSKFPGDQSGDRKSCEVFENRIKKISYDQKLFKTSLAEFGKKQNLLVSEHYSIICWADLFCSHCSLGK